MMRFLLVAVFAANATPSGRQLIHNSQLVAKQYGSYQAVGTARDNGRVTRMLTVYAHGRRTVRIDGVVRCSRGGVGIPSLLDGLQVTHLRVIGTAIVDRTESWHVRADIRATTAAEGVGSGTANLFFATGNGRLVREAVGRTELEDISGKTVWTYAQYDYSRYGTAAPLECSSTAG